MNRSIHKPSPLVVSMDAVFAGGCFWCVEKAFRELDGVGDVMPGYAGGNALDASYERVSTGTTEHREAVRVTYDPQGVSYRELVASFFSHIDPLDDGGQFTDRGPQYRTAIYWSTSQERLVAEEEKRRMHSLWKAPIATDILERTTFFPAEEEHRRYAAKNPVRYALYEHGSGRRAQRRRR